MAEQGKTKQLVIRNLSQLERELVHVLACPICGHFDLHEGAVDPALLPPDLPFPDEEETGEIDGGIWDRLRERTPEAIAEAQQRRERADALFGELAAMPSEDRQRNGDGERFRSLDLLEVLLEASQEAQLLRLEDASSFAETAIRLATNLMKTCEEGEEEDARSGLMRAYCLAANANRLQHKWLDARIDADNAAGVLDSVEDRAVYCRTVGLLRWEKGFPDEASALLQYAFLLFRFLDDEALPGCAALLGLLHAEQAWYRRGHLYLLKAWKDLDRQASPAFASRVGLALAFTSALGNRPDRAREVLRDVWQLQRCVSDGRERIRVFWQEARVLSRLGETQEARQMLRSVRDRLTEEGEESFAEAFLVSLDLAVVYQDAGELEKIPKLANDLERRFPGAERDDIQDAQKIFGELRERAGDSGACFRNAAEGIAASLRRSLRLLGLPFQPIPFA